MVTSTTQLYLNKTMISNKRQQIAEINPEAILWDDLDDAVIGITLEGRVVYDIRLLEETVYKNNEHHMDIDEAKEWIAYNILSTYVGEWTPIHIWTLDND